MNRRFEEGEDFDASEGLALPEEIAELYRVDPATVKGWARNGLVPNVRTPGGHWRLSVAYHRRHREADHG